MRRGEERDQQNPGLCCLTRKRSVKFPRLDLDVTKLTVSTKGLPCSGYDMAKILNSEYGIQTEMSDFQNVLLFVSPGNTAKELKKFVAALRKIVVDYKDMFMNQKETPEYCFSRTLSRTKRLIPGRP